MKSKVHLIETTNDCEFQVSIAHIQESQGLNKVNLPNEIAFIITEYDDEGKEKLHVASLTKKEARKLALVLMDLAK